MKYIYFFFATALLALALSCAKQTTPTGGPKDTIPPTLINSIPINKTINFKANQLVLEFDEYVIVEDAREQLIVTPAISPDDMLLTAQRKTVTLKLEKPLKDSTTYTFNFRESTKDITEKNPAKNLQIAISTGTYIDSLYIQGSTLFLRQNKPIEDATIALVEANDTFNIFKHKPTYITRSDKEGNFRIENLKPDTYFIYSFTDKNKNLIVDSKTEAFGFKAKPVTLTSRDTVNITIPVINLDSRDLKVTSARPYNTYYNIKLSKALQTFHINEPDQAGEISYVMADDNSSIRVYRKNVRQDSIAIHFTATDSIDNKIDTTLFVKARLLKASPEKFITTKLKSTLTQTPNELLVSFKFNKPLQSIFYDSILYLVDSANVFSFDKSLTQYDTLQNSVALRSIIPKEFLATKDLRTKQKDEPTTTPLNKLYLAKGSFISIEDDSSQLIRETLQPTDESNSGTIQVEIQTTAAHYITEIVDSQFKVVSSTRNNPSSTFKNLPPAEYQIRLIIDTNENGKWDPGSYQQKAEPEPIKYFIGENEKQIVSLKANWEVGPLLITYP